MLKKPAKINAVILAIVLTCIVFSQTGQGYISNELPLDQQSSMQGGCNEYCKLALTGCWNVPDCGEGGFCLEGVLVCVDSTSDEYCDYDGGSICVEDYYYPCNYKVTLDGYCYKGQICTTNFYNLGSCVDAGSEWASQCHTL